MHKVNHKRAVLAIALFTLMLVGGSILYTLLGPSDQPVGPHNVSALRLATHTTVDGAPLPRGTYGLFTRDLSVVGDGTTQLTLGWRHSCVYSSKETQEKGIIEFQATSDTYKCVTVDKKTLFRLRSIEGGLEVIWVETVAPQEGTLYFYKTK